MSCGLGHHTLQRYFCAETGVGSSTSKLSTFFCVFRETAVKRHLTKLLTGELQCPVDACNVDEGKMSFIFLIEKILMSFWCL